MGGHGASTPKALRSRDRVRRGIPRRARDTLGIDCLAAPARAPFMVRLRDRSAARYPGLTWGTRCVDHFGPASGIRNLTVPGATASSPRFPVVSVSHSHQDARVANINRRLRSSTTRADLGRAQPHRSSNRSCREHGWSGTTTSPGIP